MERATYTVDQVAALLGVGRDTVFRQINDTGEIAGVPVIKVGRRKVIPAARLNTALGIESTQTERDAA